MPPPSKRQPSRAASRTTVAPEPLPVIPAGLRLLGVLFLLVAIAAAFVLALDHFALVTPPGCGPQSGCDRATRSQWGTIPGLDWPTSLAGVAYFSALLAAWLASPRAIHPLLRIIVWTGVVASLLLTGVMLRHGFVCKYCIATHLANMAFLGVLEFAARRTAPAVPGMASITAGVLAFVVATVALAIGHQQTSARRLARSEAELRASTDEIARRSAATPASTGATTTTTQPTIATTQAGAVGPPPPNPADVGPPRPDVGDTSAAQTPFTGRWRLGPENAPIRIVMFMDYQCEDCQMMESQAAALLTRRSDVSLSVKHFPMCADCNPHIGGLRMHPNACWAARAAEAAGMLRGNDGFWQMHNWMFQRRGSFTDSNFPPALQELGYDPNQFIQTMSSNATLQNVLADVAEGNALGLHFTPLIFINGVELRGFIGNPGALTRAVDDLAARNLPPGSALNDHPVKAADKYIEDWRTQPPRLIPADSRPHVLGNASGGAAKVTISVWGDLQDPFTAELDGVIRSLINANTTSGSLRYDFRLYPADQSCNPNVQRTVYASSCIAARAAEAAAMLAGEEAYWKMHAWLLAHTKSSLNDELLKQAAADCGLDAAALLNAMGNPEVAGAIAQDIQTGAGMVMSGQIPTVYINGKWLPRWKLESQKVLERIVQAAGGG